jgi:hypothetical protein
MRIVLSFWIFYKKLIIPVISMSSLFGISEFIMTRSYSLSFKSLGISYIVFTPMFHYYIYEIRNPNEYYFYYNMGISKPVLWLSTLIFSSLIGLILILI